MPKAKKPKPKATTPLLLPCPFCGAAPVVDGEVVTCANPDCLVQPETNTLTLAGARQAWHRRAP